MHFKTAAEIKAQKEAAGKSSQQEEKRKAKLAEKANRKYARMAEESAKREAARKAKPQVKVLPGVIVAPALLASKKEIQQVIKAESKFYGGRPVTGRIDSSQPNISNAPKPAPKADAKQVWDEATKQWVKKS
jgi:hypothetical protein